MGSTHTHTSRNAPNQHDTSPAGPTKIFSYPQAMHQSTRISSAPSRSCTLLLVGSVDLVPAASAKAKARGLHDPRPARQLPDAARSISVGSDDIRKDNRVSVWVDRVILSAWGGTSCHPLHTQTSPGRVGRVRETCCRATQDVVPWEARCGRSYALPTYPMDDIFPTGDTH